MSSSSKTDLRSRVLALRRALGPERRQQLSEAIVRRVAALPAFARAQAIACHAPMGAEVDITELARSAAAAGKVVAWPLIAGDGSRVLTFRSCAVEALVPGPRGTRQPPDAAPALPVASIDLIVVPGVAFDAQLRRLGRGGGYYDATLPLLPSSALRVAVAFSCQVVPAVPAEPHDARVDLLVTESGTLAGRSE